MNMVPIDICIKGMIIASYRVWKEREMQRELEIPIYNSASVKIVTYDSFNDASDAVMVHPSMQCVGIPSMTFTKCVLYAWLLRIFRNLIPALILDALLLVSGNKPK